MTYSIDINIEIYFFYDYHSSDLMYISHSRDINMEIYFFYEYHSSNLMYIIQLI